MFHVVVYLYVNGSGSITSVGQERAKLSAVVYLQLCGFCLERFPLPLGAWDGLRYLIVTLPEPSILLFFISDYHTIKMNDIDHSLTVYQIFCSSHVQLNASAWEERAEFAAIFFS